VVESRHPVPKKEENLRGGKKNPIYGAADMKNVHCEKGLVFWEEFCPIPIKIKGHGKKAYAPTEKRVRTYFLLAFRANRGGGTRCPY